MRVPRGRSPVSQEVLDPRATVACHWVPPGVLLTEESDTISSVKCPWGPGPDLPRGKITLHFLVGMSEGDCDRISLKVPKEPIGIFLQIMLDDLHPQVSMLG